MMELSGRERALVACGYDEETVKRLSFCTEQEAETAAEAAFFRAVSNDTPEKHPICVFIGGQPGSGKSTLCRRLSAANAADPLIGEPHSFISIAMDDYRSYHPRYSEMEEEIRRHFENREETEFDSPGNDIACFTQRFAGMVIDLVLVKLLEPKDGCYYSVCLEWAMREAEEPLAMMRRLKSAGYRIFVWFLAVNGQVSKAACFLRAKIMNSHGHVFRRIPSDFHDQNVENLPESCETIYEKGFLSEKLIEEFLLLSRNDEVLWSPGSPERPGTAYRKILKEGEQHDNRYGPAEEAYMHEAAGLERKTVDKPHIL